MISVLFVCLGNICRSPLGEGIFKDHISNITTHSFHVDSAGTSSYHVGEHPDWGSIRVAKKHGIDISKQRSRQLIKADFERFDFIVAMDRSNLRNAKRIGSLSKDRLLLLRDFDPVAKNDLDVPDPWSRGDRAFENVYEIIARSMDDLTAHIRRVGERS